MPDDGLSINPNLVVDAVGDLRRTLSRSRGVRSVTTPDVAHGGATESLAQLNRLITRLYAGSAEQLEQVAKAIIQGAIDSYHADQLTVEPVVEVPTMTTTSAPVPAPPTEQPEAETVATSPGPPTATPPTTTTIPGG